MNRFRINGKYCDVRIRAGNGASEKEFLAHRIVLASESKFFEITFDKNSSAVVSLPRIDAAVFEEVLNVMYTGKINVTEQNVGILLSPSNDLNDLGLQFYNEWIACITNNLPISYVNDVHMVEIFRNAYNTKNMKLVAVLVKYIAENFVRFSKLNTFLTAPIAALQLVLTHRNLENPSDCIAEFILDWVVKDPDSRREVLSDVLGIADRLQDLVSLWHKLFSNRKWLAEGEGELRSRNEDLTDGEYVTNDEYVTDEDEDSLPFLRPEIHKTLQVYVETLTYPNKSLSMDIYAVNEKKQWTVVQKLNSSIPETEDVFTVKAAFLGEHRYTFFCTRTQFEFVVDLDHSQRESKNLAVPPPHCPYIQLAVTDTIIAFDKLASNKKWKSQLWKYNCRTNEWSEITEIRNYVFCKYASFISMGNLLYVLGGREIVPNDGSGRGLAQFYDERSPSWNSLPKMSSRHEQGSACAHNGKLYVSGGHIKQDLVEVYDPVAGKWDSVAPMTQEKRSHILVSDQNKLYAVGGWEQTLNTCCYDEKRNTWSDYGAILNQQLGEQHRVYDVVVRQFA